MQVLCVLALLCSHQKWLHMKLRCFTEGYKLNCNTIVHNTNSTYASLLSCR